MAQIVKNLPCNEGNHGRPNEGHGNPLQWILAWRTPMDRGAWRAAVPGVAMSRTLSDLSTAQLLQSCCCSSAATPCLTLCSPTDCSPPGSSVRGISQARIPERVAISFSRGSSQPRKWIRVSCIDRWIFYHWSTREAHFYHRMSFLLQRTINRWTLGCLADIFSKTNEASLSPQGNNWQYF